MELLDQHVDEFIALYKKHYGVVLSHEDAIRKGKKLVRFVQMVDFSNDYENEDEKTRT